jgi:uncharacterized repeat protein (TIGR01451 family)
LSHYQPAQNFQVDSFMGYAPLYDRPPLAQTFTGLSSGDQISIVVNHFKSKGSCPASGPDSDQGDGAGCWNAKRVAQSTYMLEIVEQLEQVDPKVIIMGDLNSYGMEAPMLVLLNGELQEQLSRFVAPEDRYSYVFDGMAGDLDHTLVTSALAGRVTGATTWHINADEASVLGYSTLYNPPSVYEPNAFRSSDHDPVILGLELDPILAAFVSNTPVALGQQAVFTNTTAGPGPIAYEWDLGDGSPPITSTSPVHTYLFPAIYTVVMTATNPYESVVISDTFQVVNNLLTGFESNSPVLIGSLAVFTNTTSGPGTISFSWDFGDDSPLASDSDPSHLYAAPGDYLVSLTAQNEMETITVSSVFQVIDHLQVEFENSPLILLGDQVVFTNTTSGFGPISYTWDFGDGNTSAVENPAHLYEATGSYTVTLAAENAFEIVQFSGMVEVVERLSASFTSSSPILLGETAVFTSSISGPGPYSYHWDFGDGSSSNEPDPTHHYNGSGDYEVSLLVSNPYELVEFLGGVQVVDHLQVGFSSSSPVLLGEPVVFTNTTTGPGSISYVWDFGDGNTSAVENPAHLYEAAGSYTVTLAAENYFESFQVSAVVEVLERLSASFTTNSPVLLGETAVFTSAVSGPGPYTYTWDFGDENSSDEANPIHHYGTAGSYTVDLRVENAYESVLISSTVDVIAHLAVSFESSSPSVLGEEAVFTSLVSGPGPYTYAWNFGDNNESSQANPVHLYEEAGVYTVVLSVSNPYESKQVEQSYKVLVPSILEITKTVSTADAVEPGEVLTYTVRLQNHGEVLAVNVTLEDLLPEALEWAGWVELPEGVVYSDGVITWSGSLAGGLDLTIVYRAAVKVDPALYGSEIVNTVVFGTEGVEAGFASASVRVVQPVVLSITKIIEGDQDKFLPGEVVTYTISVNNNGAIDALNIHIMDVLPEQLSGAGLDEMVDIAAGESVTYTIAAVVGAGAQPGQTVTNTATYTHGSASGSASASFQVLEVVDTGKKLYLPLLMR